MSFRNVDKNLPGYTASRTGGPQKRAITNALLTQNYFSQVV